MGSGAWLRLLLTLGALWETPAREPLLAPLGYPTTLRIPRKLRELTRDFGEASWKRSTDDPRRKKFLVRISGGNFTEFEPRRLRFHEQEFSLEILNISREDARLYEYSVSKGQEEEVWQIRLEVLEPVADPTILILGRELSNGSCSVALRCSAERGDEVSYVWGSRENGTGIGAGICTGNGSFRNLSYSLRDARFGCVCTASNAVSSRHSEAFEAAQCGTEQWGGPGLRLELLVPLVALGAIAIVLVVIVTVRATRVARGDQDLSLLDPDPAQATLDSASPTIYAQVQRRQNSKGTVPSSCATIYAAATGPPLDPDRAPRTPVGTPWPRGPPKVSQEPTTVYASVTLPEA